MQYKDIISISNLSGLYSLVTTKGDGAIVNSLSDGTKKFVSSRKHDFTPLESIEVYTVEDNVPLSEIFVAMVAKDKEVKAIDLKKATKDEIQDLMLEVYPDLDLERVYMSDLKKMIKWYRILDENKLIEELEKEQNVSDEEE